MADNPTTTAAPGVAAYPHGQVPRAVREEQLLTIAEELFVEHGYSGASIGMLATRAGVSRPIVYEHFGSKDGLYLAVARRIRAELNSRLLANAAEAANVEELLRDGQTAYLRLIQQDPKRWWLVYGGAGVHIGELADGLAELREGTVALIAEIFHPHLQGADPADLLLLAHAISGAGEQMARYWRRHQEVPLERMVDAYVRSLLPGVEALRG